MNPKELRILNEITAQLDKAIAKLKLKVKDIEINDEGEYIAILEPKKGPLGKASEAINGLL